jgi:hypothetical protein
MTTVDRYRAELEGRTVRGLERDEWCFCALDTELEAVGDETLHLCLDHSPAQFHFAIDDEFRVFVHVGAWVKIYGNLFEMVEMERFKHQIAAGRPASTFSTLGIFPSLEAFENEQAERLVGYQKIPYKFDELNALFSRTNELVVVGRFFSIEMSLHAKHFRWGK